MKQVLSGILKVQFWMGAILLMNGCGSTPEAKLSDWSFDRSATNKAVIFGAPNDLMGIDDDIRLMKDMLEYNDNFYGFDVQSKYRASKTEIMDMTRRAAAQVSESGTLFWYFSGHGAQSGLLMGEPGMVDFDEVTKAIKDVRSTPLKRLVVMIDACFSGQMVDGRLAIGRNETQLTSNMEIELVNGINYGSGDYTIAEESAALSGLSADMVDSTVSSFVGAAGYGLVASGKLMDQLLVVSASSRNNTSLAGSNGSTFTRGVSQAFGTLSGQNGSTLNDFLTNTISNTKRNSGGHHTPQFRAVPENILQEKLVGAENNIQSQNQDNDIYLRLGKVSGDATFPAYISGGETVSKVYLCKGEVDVCKQNPTSIVNFSKTTGLSGRSLFKAETIEQLEGNTTYNLVGVDGNNNIRSMRKIQFEKQ